MGVKQAVTGALGSAPASWLSTAISGNRLRIVAYHGLQSPRAFERQLQHLVERFTPVTGERVAAACSGGPPLPRRAVWVTFDDGHPEVVTHGRPLLDRYGIRAAMFICPAVVDTEDPYWWEIVRAAQDAGLTPVVDDAWETKGLSPEEALKRLPDRDRRDVVASLASALEDATGSRLRRTQVSSKQLREWVAGGHEVGSHTWDHPLLDRCDAAAQREQVRRAHEWIHDVLQPSGRFFAYPNGNAAKPAADELRSRGYDLGLAFDHRLAQVHRDPLYLSRLRADTDAELKRYRAILSGAHSGLFNAYRWRVERGSGRKRAP